METLFGKAINDLATLLEQKWFAAMGMVGLLVFAWVLIRGTPHDDVLIGAIAVAMMGFGFGEAESRTFRMGTIPGYLVKAPERQRTWPGIALYTLGTIGLATALFRAFF